MYPDRAAACPADRPAAPALGDHRHRGLNAVAGVPKGSFAIALKLHHCAVDGMASVQMIAALHDLAADSPRPAGPDGRWQPGPLPSTVDLLSRTALNAVLQPLRAGTVLASSAP